MRKRILFTVAAIATCVPLWSQSRGDLNGDDNVDVTDVSLLIDVVLGKTVGLAEGAVCDLNGDGSVDVTDVSLLIDIVLGKVPVDPGPPGPADAEVITVNGVSFKMVPIQGGTFTMGATAEQGTAYESDERPTHQVKLNNYSIGATEVTQELWQAVMGDNPSEFTGNLQRPVENVSWYDCKTFITKLNQLTGRTFRLPTEAEWEYAARGGNKTKKYMYSGSNTIGDVAWYEVNAYNVDFDDPAYGPHAVGTKLANELGIHDMSGNVWEWCQDWYSDSYYTSKPVTNPTGPNSGISRVFRGGSWDYYAKDCRVSNRSSSKPEYLFNYLGLRLAL